MLGLTGDLGFSIDSQVDPSSNKAQAKKKRRLNTYSHVLACPVDVVRG